MSAAKTSAPALPTCPSCKNKKPAWSGIFIFTGSRSWSISQGSELEAGREREDDGFWDDVKCDRCDAWAPVAMLETVISALGG